MYFLDFMPMNKQDMIDYLGELEDLEEKIPEMLLDVYKKCESQEECIYRNTFHSPEMDGGSKDKYKSGDPVYRTFVVTNKDLERQTRAVEQKIRRIRSWQQKLEHVQYCLLLLPGDQRESLTVYIKKESPKAYAGRKCLSESTDRRIRRKAMDNLLCRYNAYFNENHEGEDQL